MEEEQKSKIDLYVEDMKKDLFLDNVNIHDKSLSVPTIKIKWITILHNEMRYLKKLENADKALIDRESAMNPRKPRFQCERELLDSGKLKAIRDAVEEQKDLISTLKDLVNMVVSQFGYEVSSAIKLMQLEN